MPAQATSPSTNSFAREREIEEQEVRPWVIAGDLGKGSFATVYKGYHEETHHQVAIKTVRKDKLTAKLFDNLQSEIQILKSLSHRHITKLIEIIRAEHHIYLIIEYCAGGDLTHYIKRRGRVDGLEYIPSPGQPLQYYPHPARGGLATLVVRSFLRQLGRALNFLRSRNLIHRDIKPQNLLLKPAAPDELAKGHPLGVPILKVADFGFARSLPNAMMAETLCGSPLYMAPEILGYQKYDATADLWSVGAVMYEMSVGRPPFRAQNHIELLQKIERSKGIKFPDEEGYSSSARAEAGGGAEHPVPDDIKALIRRLLRRVPAERCSFEEFFSSEAMAKSKFPRPKEAALKSTSPSVSIATSNGQNREPARVADATQTNSHFRRPSENGMLGELTSRTRPSSGSHSPPVSASPPRSASRRASGTPNLPKPHKPMADTSVIPGETVEDGILRRDYVMVEDTRAIEFNKAVDELGERPRRPLHDRRIPSSPLVEEAANANTTFPPPPNPHAPPLSSSPSSLASRAASNALNRALSLASKKLFGTSQNKRSSLSNNSPPNMKRNNIIALVEDGKRDPLEDKLLRDLEELAQKTDALTHWADEMYEYVKAIPQKPLPDPSKFVRKDGEGEKQAKKRREGDLEAEYNAVTCVAVYITLMSFSQKGIDKLRNHQEHMKMRHPDEDFIVSEGFDDALGWFKDHFIKCNERATLVKTWLPAQYSGPRSWIDQLVYDRALLLSRTAARKELLDQATSPDECEKLYQESLWCLYALQDDLLQTGNPFMDEDRSTIDTWIKRTKTRLSRCPGKNENDRPGTVG
ncbi:other/ULK/ULK protein kinase [Flagelloscypha sp. PMI_526]|nr:other/ULK/ULK protein kinase [Flagelloscypha sp. PMI_526]